MPRQKENLKLPSALGIFLWITYLRYVETKYFKRKRRCRTYAGIDKSDDKNYNLVTRAMY